jgi:hypothetical protein
MSCTSPFTGRHDDAALGARGQAGRRLLGLDERHEMRDRLLHDARALDHLRQEHLARAEQVSDDVHAVHQRSFDHLDRPSAARGYGETRLLGVLDDPVGDAFDQRVRESAPSTGVSRQRRSSSGFLPCACTTRRT